MGIEDWAGIEIPDVFKLGPGGFAEICGWRLRNSDDGGLSVCTEENYLGGRPGLVTAHLVGVAGDSEFATGPVKSWPPHDDGMADMRDVLGEEVQRLLETGKREEFWAAFGIAIKEVRDRELPDFLAAVVRTLQTQMPEASVWAVTISPKVFARTGAARSLFAGLENPEVIEESKRASREEFKGFRALEGLQTGTMFGLEEFFEIAFMVATPWLVGIGGARVGGYIAVLFGTKEIGKAQRPAAELLQLYQPTGFAIRSSLEVVSVPEFTAEDVRGFFRWWVNALDGFFGTLLDPSNFVSDGIYDPRQHVAALAGVQRLFSAVQGVLAHTRRDELARLLYFFTVLDQLEGMRHRDFKELVRLTKVRHDFSQLETECPEAVKAVLFPKLNRAVDALEAVGEGFHVASRRQGDTIQVKRGGGWINQPIDSAAAYYLKLMRDSTHSFASMALDPDEISLLGAHEGHLSPWLADLALLHLVRFITKPEALLPVRKMKLKGRR